MARQQLSKIQKDLKVWNLTCIKLYPVTFLLKLGEKKDASVKILFIRFLKIRLFSQYVWKGEGEGNDGIAIPLETQAQHGIIFH